MGSILLHIVSALSMAFAMFWEILWPLILGFTLSGVVQGVVSKSEMSRLLPDDSPRSLAIACGLGAASSSCSYAAAALARSIFRKGANFTATMAFELASTNLVAELAIILIVLMGWQFMIAEFAGAPLMVAIMALLFRAFLSQGLLRAAKEQADKGVAGVMEGHAEMDMAITEGPLVHRIFSAKGLTAASHYFVMDWVSIWFDIALGVLLAGALAAWVPETFWRLFFLTAHPTLTKFWGPIIGPFVAIISFVCSVGNIPLAAVLWNGGISFGGVVAFILADLIVLPILDIYRRYYGATMSLFILATFYFSMSLASLAIEFAFLGLGLIPAHQARVVEASVQFNYTTILNVIFLVLVGLMLWRFFTTGGPEMLRHMTSAPGQTATGAIAHMTGDHSQPSHKYTCPMHASVIQDDQGKCPKCGMTLVERR
jgi:uncharacterized membrane protein YraQ (UPF0718 family)